jgi:hypothetical protein
MKIIIVSAATVLVFFIALLTIKLWGKAQTYHDYKHMMLQSVIRDHPIEFTRPSYEHLNEIIESDKNIYLDVVVTFDQKLVIPKRKWVATEKPIRLFSYDEVKNDVILVADIKDHLIKKKIIFNLNENAQAIHETFMHDMKLIGLNKGENFIVTSQFEAPIKALKEIAPALVYGSTQPEILKIVAMQSMYLLEAVNIRADVIIHPIKIRKLDFFNQEIVSELKKRFKKIIVGPVNPEELTEAVALKPFAIILNY